MAEKKCGHTRIGTTGIGIYCLNCGVTWVRQPNGELQKQAS